MMATRRGGKGTKSHREKPGFPIEISTGYYTECRCGVTLSAPSKLKLSAAFREHRKAPPPS